MVASREHEAVTRPLHEAGLQCDVVCASGFARGQWRWSCVDCDYDVCETCSRPAAERADKGLVDGPGGGSGSGAAELTAAEEAAILRAEAALAAEAAQVALEEAELLHYCTAIRL